MASGGPQWEVTHEEDETTPLGVSASTRTVTGEDNRTHSQIQDVSIRVERLREPACAARPQGFARLISLLKDP